MMAQTLAAAVLAVLLTATHAHAQSESFCRGDAHNVERDLALHGNRIAPQDRLVMERRLSRSSGLCGQDPSRASSDLEQLRRDMILQAQRPPSGDAVRRPPYDR